MTLMVPPEWRGVASVALSVALAVWSSCLLKAWRRKQSELRFRWRVAIVEELELHRIEFKGAWRFSPLTGKMEPFFSSQERLVRYLITWPLFGAAISVLILFQVLVFRMEEMFAVRFTGMIVFLPTALYTASLPLISQGYTKIALKLTKFENHRTQGAHDRAFSAKQVIFQCAVYYLSLFYILLWKRDLKRLQEQLAIIFIIRQVVSNMAELGIPLVFALVNTYKVSKKKNHLKAYEYEAGLAVYPGTFDDHLEILIQFGYIFLFGWSWPLAAFFAYLNNVVELRTDLLKLCTGMQKPLPKEYNGIEIWLTMFEILSLGGVITNTIYLIIICYTDEIDFLPGISLPDKICIVLFIEHIILFVRMAIGHLFDDESSDTRELQAKEKLQTGWPKSEASHEITSKKND